MQVTRDIGEVQPDCPHALDATAYALGRLAPDAGKAFEDHAAGCAACGQALADARVVVTRLRNAPELTCPPELAQRILAQVSIDNDAPPAQFLPQPMRWPAHLRRLAATLVLLLSLTIIALEARRAGWLPTPSASDTAPVSERTPVRAETPLQPADACVQARAWLCRVQQPDGGWRAGTMGGLDTYDIGVSGLALLALLNDAPATPSPAHAPAVRRGVDYLVSRQGADGLFGPACAGAPYNQGMATLAILEACARTSNALWQAAAARGVACLTGAQDASGGWGYWHAPAGAVNTGATLWPLLALHRAARLGHPAAQPSVERGLQWLRLAVNGDGRMGYASTAAAPADSDTLTAAGAVCFLRDNHPASRRLVAAMLPAVRQSLANAPSAPDFYQAFFASEALLLARDTTSTTVRTAARQRLLALQRRGDAEAGMWAVPDRWSGVGGPVYATALAALALRAD